MSQRFTLGIDLGTTNSAVAITDLATDRTDIVEITQILGPNRIGEKPTLPSALYIPHPDEFPEGSFPLPWRDGADGARDHRPLRPRARGAGAGSPRHLRQVLAFQSAHRREAAHPAVELGDPGEAVSIRLFAPLPGASQAGLSLRRTGARTGLGAFGRAYRPDRAGVVRRGRAQPHGGSRRGGRARQGHAAGRAAGGVLRLDRAGGQGMARPGQSRRHRAGVRRRRRHRRLQPDRRHRERRRAGAWSASASANISFSAATTWTWRSRMRCAPSWKRKARRSTNGSSWRSCMPPRQRRSRCSRTPR